MGQELNHQQIARNLAKAMADKANENELRRLCEETMFQQFILMEKLNYLSFYGMDNQTQTLKF